MPIRPAAGRGVRGGRDGLRRPDRRAAFHAHHHRPVPQASRRHRCPHRARVRIRLDPVRSVCLCALSQGRRGRHGRTRRYHVRLARILGRLLRRHGRVDDGSDARRLHRSRRAASARRSVLAEHRPGRGIRPGRTTRPAVAARRRHRSRVGRVVDGGIPDGGVEHPRRAAQQRASGLGVRSAIPLFRER